ncbi:TetR/AcrR family transcriptional regulator [Nonomuraea sp. NPDC049141]|uniref:TetR/AcrR family transcriptional regulator n=1 Tax=Nonomuraea sp. NPDC049141 TaxID=3155500 RepID=UPI0033D44173
MEKRHDTPAPSGKDGTDRRQLRRQKTLEEILQIAVEVMTEEGVAALRLSEVARRMGIQPPSLYKYFPSKLAVYDALFQRGWERTLVAFQQAAKEAAPGLPALTAGCAAVGRLALEAPVLMQLTSWRTVPGFEPSPAAYAPSVAFQSEVSRVVQEAAHLGQLHPDAASEEGGAILSVLFAGVITQQMANDPAARFGEGRFTRLLPTLLTMFARTYPSEGDPP